MTSQQFQTGMAPQQYAAQAGTHGQQVPATGSIGASQQYQQSPPYAQSAGEASWQQGAVGGAQSIQQQPIQQQPGQQQPGQQQPVQQQPIQQQPVQQQPVQQQPGQQQPARQQSGQQQPIQQQPAQQQPGQQQPAGVGRQAAIPQLQSAYSQGTLSGQAFGGSHQLVGGSQYPSVQQRQQHLASQQFPQAQQSPSVQQHPQSQQFQQAPTMQQFPQSQQGPGFQQLRQQFPTHQQPSQAQQFPTHQQPSQASWSQQSGSQRQMSDVSELSQIPLGSEQSAASQYPWSGVRSTVAGASLPSSMGGGLNELVQLQSGELTTVGSILAGQRGAPMGPEVAYSRGLQQATPIEIPGAMTY